MFVRWIVRGHRNADVADVNFHDAYLVESYRDDDGQPRQKTVAYLGNIRQISGEFPTIERELFILRARLIMDSMPELSEEIIDQILTQLQDKIPPLTAEEVQIGFETSIQWYFQWWQANADTHGSFQDEILRLTQSLTEQAASFENGCILPAE